MNENHGEDGRFTSGDGAGSSAGSSASRWSAETPGPGYHITYAKSLQSIAREGLSPKGRGGIGANSGLAERSAGKTFLTDKEGVGFWRERLEAHADDRTDDAKGSKLVPVTLRISKDVEVEHDEPGSNDSNARAVMTHEAIEPEHIEFFYDRAWHPVTDLLPPEKGEKATPERERLYLAMTRLHDVFTTEKDPDGGRDLHWLKPDHENPLVERKDGHDPEWLALVARMDFDGQARDDHGRFAEDDAGGAKGGDSAVVRTLFARASEQSTRATEAKTKAVAKRAAHAAMPNKATELRAAVQEMQKDPTFLALQKEADDAHAATEVARTLREGPKRDVHKRTSKIRQAIVSLPEDQKKALFETRGTLPNMAGTDGGRFSNESATRAITSLRDHVPPGTTPEAWNADLDALAKAHAELSTKAAAEHAAFKESTRLYAEVQAHPATRASKLLTGSHDERTTTGMSPKVQDLARHERERGRLASEADTLEHEASKLYEKAAESERRAHGSGVDLLPDGHVDMTTRSMTAVEYSRVSDAQVRDIRATHGERALQASARFTATYDNAGAIRAIQAGTATDEMLRSVGNPATLRSDAEYMDRITKAPLDQPTKVYRGIRLTKDEADALVKSKTISLSAVASSATSAESAAFFLKEHEEEPGYENKKVGVLLEIKAKRGYFATRYEGASIQEIVLPRGSNYQIRAVTRDVETGYVHVVAEDTHGG